MLHFLKTYLYPLQVILQFSENFWQGKVKGDDFFGRVPQDASQRGLFNLFYTVPAKKVKSDF